MGSIICTAKISRGYEQCVPHTEDHWSTECSKQLCNDFLLPLRHPNTCLPMRDSHTVQQVSTSHARLQFCYFLFTGNSQGVCGSRLARDLCFYFHCGWLCRCSDLKEVLYCRVGRCNDQPQWVHCGRGTCSLLMTSGRVRLAVPQASSWLSFHPWSFLLAPLLML